MTETIATTVPTSSRPQRWRAVRHYAYVDRPFRQVRRHLAAAPARVLARPVPGAEDSRGWVDLHVERAGVDLARDVQVVLGTMEVGTHSARLPLRWEDARRPGLFPVLEATLEVIPISAGRRQTTQLGFVGRYQPPLGRVGALADTLAGNRVVLESVERFLDDLAARLEQELPSQPEPEVGAAPPAPSPATRRRVFLPLDHLASWPGGAFGVDQRLRAEPGVVEVVVDPVAELAIIDYDATTCSVGRLLEVLDGDGTGG